MIFRWTDGARTEYEKLLLSRVNSNILEYKKNKPVHSTQRKNASFGSLTLPSDWNFLMRGCGSQF